MSYKFPSSSFISASTSKALKSSLNLDSSITEDVLAKLNNQLERVNTEIDVLKNKVDLEDLKGQLYYAKMQKNE